MPAPLLIATAGHVDHGKSTLIHRLTGIDPDRWAEEKERGITIDLGYAHLAHEDRAFSFVDVPGHEKFIHNMLAGIGSIDAVLFVIAADESIMPQTREHAKALAYLGVTQIAIVLTKVDLVDEDLLALVHMEIDEWSEELGWKEAPRVCFSAKQPATTLAVLKLLESFTKKTSTQQGATRISLDRIFTAPGSGTVITGTTDRGSVKRGESLVLLPGELATRVRQLQVHGCEQEEAGPHERVALNLSGVHYKELHRGFLLYGGDPPKPATTILVRLQVFEQGWLPSPRHRFHLHHLAAHLMGRLLWLEGDLAAFALQTAYAFQALDRGLIRDGSPLSVCAGFQVLLPRLYPAKRRKLSTLLQDPPEQDLDLLKWQTWYLRQQAEGCDVTDLKRACGFDLLPQLRQDLIFIDAHYCLAKQAWQTNLRRLTGILKSCHRDRPFFDSLPLHLIQSRCREQKWSNAMMQRLFKHEIEAGQLELKGDRIRKTDHQPSWDANSRRLLDEFLAPLKQEPPVIDPRRLPSAREAYASLEELLLWEQWLISISPDLLVHYQFINRICIYLHEHYRGQVFSVTDLKSAFALTRKFAIPLLEFLDKTGCSQRQGEGRLWIAGKVIPRQSNWKPPGSSR